MANRFISRVGMADVFISYAHQDRPYADGRGLERVLKSNAPELSLWRDDGISAGASWSVEIETQLRSAKCVVVIWSVNSWASPWVRQEAFYGYMREILIPLCVDDQRPRYCGSGCALSQRQKRMPLYSQDQGAPVSPRTNSQAADTPLRRARRLTERQRSFVAPQGRPTCCRWCRCARLSRTRGLVGH